nr:abscisic aldehyde oxidase 3 [Tanacetum cinerariifolium]
MIYKLAEHGLRSFVVTDTQKIADVAAGTVVIGCNMEDLESPILTVEQAVKRSSFFEVPSILYPSQVGDFAKGMVEVRWVIGLMEVIDDETAQDLQKKYYKSGNVVEENIWAGFLKSDRKKQTEEEVALSWEKRQRKVVSYREAYAPNLRTHLRWLRQLD